VLFKIDHLTLYRYSSPVLLGEHHLRFSPLQRAGQRLIDCNLQIDPRPVHSEEIVDTWGNSTRCLRFQGETERLDIRACLEVETSEPFSNPSSFDFPMPVDYADESGVLGPYLETLEDASALRSFVEPLADLAEASGVVRAPS